MKKLLAPFAAAFAVVAAPAAFAQDNTAPETPAAVVDKLCASLAAGTQTTCTDEQKARAEALITEIEARGPAADRFVAMRNMYDFYEGMRQIFNPNRPPLAQPPVDEIDERAYNTCARMQQNMGYTCTPAQREELRQLIGRVAALPAPRNEEEARARRDDINRSMREIFPDVPVAQTPPPAVRDSTPPYAPRIQRAPNARVIV